MDLKNSIQFSIDENEYMLQVKYAIWYSAYII